MASDNAEIPRYLRYKTGGENADDVRNHELERANKILHTRIIRMHRDQLCQGCARFDWSRTHFYTRQVHWTTEKDKEAGQKIRIEDQQKSRDDLDYRDLETVLDDVIWSQFEVLAGARREAKWLAKDPRFRWQLRSDQVRQCKLCNSLWNKAEVAEEISTPRGNSSPALLNILLKGGPVFEDGNRHQCIDAWPYYETSVRSATNGFKVYLWGDKDFNAWTSFSCCIRPFIEKTPSQSNESPHCCIGRRRVDETVNFDLVTGWLKSCDRTHEHGTSSAHSISAIKDVRFIDTKSRCIVKQDQCVRYAALSYSWGRGEQFCLKQANVKALEECGSLDRADVSLRKVVVDAIEVCTKTDIPYLWVDALCIIQDDTHGKMLQIQNMDSIYSNAYMTIVEAAQKEANHNQSPFDQSGSLCLSRVSTPLTPTGPSFIIDGVSYLVDADDIYETLNENFSTSKWSSRGWTFQELALSHRILVFMAEEAVFYCSKGVACESIYLGDDLYRTLPLMNQLYQHQQSSIQICGFVYKSPSKSTTMTDFVQQYEKHHLQLLSFYIGRNLSYETDVLNAFSGIINAQRASLGHFEAGLPLRLFARSLLLTISPESSPLSRRPGFPSWSWIGWRLDSSTPITVFNDGSSKYSQPRGYWMLVQIYSCTESRAPVLLLGPLHLDNGIEGYCTHSINFYNELTPAPPLPTEPCVEQVPFAHVSSEESAQRLLIFWTHVARLDLTFPTENGIFPEVHIDCPKIRARFEEEEILKLEVVVVAITRGITYDEGDEWAQPWELEDSEQEFSGIIIERWQGLARRVGVVHNFGIEQWVAAGPQKELLLLA